MYSPSQHDIPILKAAASGDLQFFKELEVLYSDDYEGFRKRCEIVQDCQGRTPLHYAAKKGKIQICRYFIQKLKLPVHVKALRGESPLLLALKKGNFSTAKYLVIKGADIKFSDCKGITSLHYAAVKANKELMRLLLLKGANIESKSIYGTPLQCAASYGCDESVRYLLDHGAQVGGEPDIRSLVSCGVNSSSIGVREHMSPARLHLVKAKAKEAVERKDYFNAIKLYSEAINFDSNDATMLSNRSLCWANLREAAFALADAEACVKLRHDWAEAHYREGVAWKLLHNYPMAAEEFSKALKLDPGNHEIYYYFKEAVRLECCEMEAKHPLVAHKIYESFNK